MLSPELQIRHGAEFRRCLSLMDVAGMRKLWEHCAPDMARKMSPAQTLTAMHMARIEQKHIRKKLKEYSIEWLKDQGWQKIDGSWCYGPPKPQGIAEAVGISSKSSVPGLANKIMTGMRFVLLNAMAKGVTEPLMQREIMLKERQRIRFKGRHI